jgi:hypothetical protein
MTIAKLSKSVLLFVIGFFSINQIVAQTDQDAIMMNKNLFCTGLMFGTSSWNKYWEGTNYRENLNLGTISSNSVSVMGNYGVKDNLNILFSAPYITNKASAGVLRPISGVQDLSAWVKWMPIEKDLKHGTFSLYLLAGASAPLSDYIVDYLPMSIGLKSNTFSGRLMLDYQLNDFFVTASETYTLRGNTTIERNAYYTTQMYLTNQVALPAVNTINVRTGYRSYWLIAEAVLNQSNTLGGFDITKNNMPFPSNRMNATSLGLNFKYEIPKVAGLSFVGGGNRVINGRNVGQSTGYYGGFFYILDFAKKKKTESASTNVSTQQN